jgi:hypothetical protein
VENKGFQFHARCSKPKLTHLCFADDLLIFFEAKLESIMVLKRVLHEFSELSGLRSNPAESTLFIALEFLRWKKIEFLIAFK